MLRGASGNLTWPVLATTRLNRGHLEALVSGGVAAVRVKDFLPAKTCAAVLAGLRSDLLTRYDPAKFPVEAYRFGPTLNEHCASGILGTGYWRAAGKAHESWTASFGHLGLHEHIATALQEGAELPVHAATLVGRPLFWPCIREISRGTLLHWDDVTREYTPDVFGADLNYQIALNIFVSVPSAGGQLRIWNREWRPTDDDSRVAFGYDESLMTGSPDMTLTPAIGDAILFGSRSYHDVLPSFGGRRVAISAFIGIASDGLLLWS